LTAGERTKGSAPNGSMHYRNSIFSRFPPEDTYLIIKYFIIVHLEEFTAEFFFLHPEVIFIIQCFWVTSSFRIPSLKIKVRNVTLVSIQAIREQCYSGCYGNRIQICELELIQDGFKLWAILSTGLPPLGEKFHLLKAEYVM
jgi:hypothetical protein